MERMWMGIGIFTFVVAILLLTTVGNHMYLKKKKIVDERYNRIHHLGRSYAWFASTGIIVIVWFLALFVFDSLLAFFLITAIYVGHMVSYAIGAAVAQSQN
ncbi:hypothetical protein MHH85_05425 [Viridibacillus sp. FSL E2-0187]|uniref:hypothetical protein n=1 Tax=Viridibacillus TaxID=496496 RepID=UPI00187B2BD4|nr:hypothetical protein [Viridibacillus sp. JNUCC-6]QOV12499.1 hypothetical protein JNUCC6_07030 [Viridibacillus sp. JNUCC-6]